MLFEIWQKIVRTDPDQVALRDLASGQSWTFGQLHREIEAPIHHKPAIVHAQGHTADFIFAVLRGWRCGAVVCPLEPYQSPTAMPLPPAPCCHLKTTSATTGAPRAIAFSAEQLAADAANIVAGMGLRPDWPNLGVISLAHSYGFSNLVLPLLLHGIPLFLAPSPLPEALRRAAQAQNDLTLPGVPAMWRAWHEAGVIPANVRLAISAGAPLPVGLEQAVFRAHGLKVHNFYGSSECGGIAYDAAATPREDEALVGRPLQDVEVGVREEGLLFVRSRAVGLTYWPEPSAQLEHGRFQTSDLAELDHGQIYLRGRAGDLINVAGRKVSPAVIEQALRQHDAVAECLVFGAPSDNVDRTDHIVACVQASRGSTAGELKHFLLAKLPSWQVPREWWFVESLAPNGRGKISRAQWKDKYLQRNGRKNASR